MKPVKCVPPILSSLLVLLILSSCAPNKTDKPPQDDYDIEPLLIEKVKSPEEITGAMWDEAYNTFLVLQIRRLVQYEGPQNQMAEVEITADIPLFGQQGKDEAAIYGEGIGKAKAIGGATGVGYSEAEWDLVYWVSGWIIGPKCSLELKIDEEWLEGMWCTTVMGITECNPASGAEYQFIYGLVEFPYIVGEAANLEDLNISIGPSSTQTKLKIVHTGEQIINLPDVKNCDLADISWEVEDDVED